MRTLIILVLLVFATTAHAGEKNTQATKSDPLETKWNNDPSLIKVVETTSEIYFGIKGTLTSSANFRTGWIAVFYKVEGRKRNANTALKDIYSTRARWNFDCSDNTVNVSSIHAYNSAGDELGEANSEVWNEVVPGSVAAHIGSIMCLPDKEPTSDDGRTAPF